MVERCDVSNLPLFFSENGNADNADLADLLRFFLIHFIFIIRAAVHCASSLPRSVHLHIFIGTVKKGNADNADFADCHRYLLAIILRGGYRVAGVIFFGS